MLPLRTVSPGFLAAAVAVSTRFEAMCSRWPVHLALATPQLSGRSKIGWPSENIVYDFRSKEIKVRMTNIYQFWKIDTMFMWNPG
jgi:hypothetical protein